MRYLFLVLVLILLANCVATFQKLGEGTAVVFTSEAEKAANFLYSAVTGVEYVACIRARQIGNVVEVYEIIIPEQTGNTKNSVENFNCREYVGFMHSHPAVNSKPDCQPSLTDLITFFDLFGRQGKSWDVMVIWCAPDKYYWRLRGGGTGVV